MSCQEEGRCHHQSILSPRLEPLPHTPTHTASTHLAAGPAALCFGCRPPLVPTQAIVLLDQDKGWEVEDRDL